MGKNLTVFVIIAFTVLALMIFWSQPSHEGIDRRMAQTSDPRIVIDDLFVQRFKANSLVGDFSAKLVHFVEPNMVEAYAEVSGMRMRDNKRETFRSQILNLQFKAQNMGKLMSSEGGGIAYIEVENDVNIKVGLEEMLTERAQYFADRHQISSMDPVEIIGPGRRFFGEQGFSYHLKTEEISIPGPVRGEVRPSDKK